METFPNQSAKLSSVNDPPLSDPLLPPVEGGWELQEGRHVQLWAPKQPDALFDPDAHVERHQYHTEMPYWAWIWDATDPCIETLLSRGIQGRVLEIGAGLGAVGIALAAKLSGQVNVTLSDYDPVAVQAMHVNAALNHIPATRIWTLDWRALRHAPPDQFDFIVGCEVIYDPTSHEALLDVLAHYLDPKSGQALIFDPGRTPAKQFTRRAKARGFQVTIESPSGHPATIEPGKPRWLTLSPPQRL